MSCQIKNNANLDLTDLQPHIDGMYDHFHQKLGFQKPPVIVFDSDPSNQSNVLGKTAYYDPQSLEVHVYTDGRHPKDMLRSIAHELIHHQQNLEGRLDVGGYNGPGYYLENDEMKKIEQEAMLKGNAILREYEDGLKLKEKNEMSLKEWKNNELNQLLLKKFGILKEEKKKMVKHPKTGEMVPDYVVDGKGQDDEAEGLEEGELKGGLKKYMDNKKKNDPDNENTKKSKKDSDSKPPKGGAPAAAEQEEEKEAELEEGRLNPRTTNPDKFVGHEDRYQPDRIHEDDGEDDGEEKLSEPPKTLTMKMTKDGRTMFKPDVEETVRRMPSEDYPGNRTGQGTPEQDRKNVRESIRNALKENRKLRLKIKR
jgi:hypothetical protein